MSANPSKNLEEKLYLYLSKNIMNKLKIARIIKFILFTALFFRFCPSNILEKLFLLDFCKKYNPIISLALIFSIIVLTIPLLENEYRKISGKVYIRYLMSFQENHLLVDSFYNKERREFDLSGDIEINSGVQKPMEFKRIIYRSSDMATEGSLCLYPYNLNFCFLRFLNKNLKEGKLIIKDGEIIFK